MRKLLCALLTLSLLTGLPAASVLPASAGDGPSDTSLLLHDCDTAVSGTQVDAENKTEGSGSWIVSLGSMMVIYDFDPVDVTAYDSLEFDLWVESTDFSQKLTGGSTQLELTSSGTHDKQEMGWILLGLITSTFTEPGWQHITLPFSNASITGGAPDYTKINHLRFFWIGASETISARIDNIRFTKAAAEAEKRHMLQEERDLAGDLLHGCNDLSGASGAEVSETVFRTGTGAWKFPLGNGGILQIAFPETDLTPYERLELDLWVEDAADVARLGGSSEIELTSSGRFDLNELHWSPDDVLTGLRDGWNHVVIPLSSGEASGGEIDLTKVNYFRWYWVGTKAEVTAYVDNIRLMRSTDEYLERETFSFMVFEESEDDYLLRCSSGRNEQKRFSDKGSETVYKFTTQHPKGARKIVFRAKVAAQLLLQVSTDETHWTEVYRWTTDEITEATDGSSFSKGLSAATISFDLTPFLDLSDGTKDIYVRIADSYPTVNGASNGWGGNIFTGVRVSLTVDYAPGEDENPEEPGPTETDGPDDIETETAGPETDAGTETGPQSAETDPETAGSPTQEKKKGCGSVIGAGLILTGLCAASGAALALRKKEEP